MSLYMEGKFFIEIDKEEGAISIELDIPGSKRAKYFIIDSSSLENALVLERLNTEEAEAIAEFLRDQEDEARMESKVTDRLIDEGV